METTEWRGSQSRGSEVSKPEEPELIEAGVLHTQEIRVQRQGYRDSLEHCGLCPGAGMTGVHHCAWLTDGFCTLSGTQITN